MGKTTVCRSILQLLLIDGASIDGDDPDFKGDFTAKLSYKGIKVAICSMGDKLSAVEENIRNYNKCDVVIVASNHTGRAVHTVGLGVAIITDGFGFLFSHFQTPLCS